LVSSLPSLKGILRIAAWVEIIQVVFNKKKTSAGASAHPIAVFVRVIVCTLFAYAVTHGHDWNSVKAHYYKAVDGDRGAGAEAVKSLDAMLRITPDNPTLIAYRGSLFLLESSWAVAPWRKGSLAKQGLTLLDKAIAMSPEDVEIRFVRAATTRRLPSIFRRGEESAADFAIVAPRAAEAVRNGKLDARLATAALHFHALNLEKAGDRTAARDACRTAIALAANTPGAEACGRRITSD
jgi:hypothetical protein